MLQFKHLLLVGVLVLPACASQTGEGALIGGALGGGTGLLLGGTDGAIAGGLLGGGIGALLGSRNEDNDDGYRRRNNPRKRRHDHH